MPWVSGSLVFTLAPRTHFAFAFGFVAVDSDVVVTAIPEPVVTVTHVVLVKYNISLVKVRFEERERFSLFCKHRRFDRWRDFAPWRRTQFHNLKPVSYTHLTLPTIYSV